MQKNTVFRWLGTHYPLPFYKTLRNTTQDIVEASLHHYADTLDDAINWWTINSCQPFERDDSENSSAPHIMGLAYLPDDLTRLVMRACISQQKLPTLMGVTFDLGRCIIESITNLFEWSATSMGHDYYRDVYDRYQSLRIDQIDYDNMRVPDLMPANYYKPAMQDYYINSMYATAKREARNNNKFKFLSFRGRHGVILDYYGKYMLSRNAAMFYNGDVDEFVAINKANLPSDAIVLRNGSYADANDTMMCDYSGHVWLNNDICSDAWAYVDNHSQYCLEDERDRHDIVWSDSESCYLDLNDATCIRTRHGSDWVSSTDDCTYCHANGDWYLDDDACRRDGYVYDENIDEWVNEDDYDGGDDDEEDDDASVRSYHHYTRVEMFGRTRPKYTLGLEVEKEDRDAKVLNDASDIYDATKWCHERDGSLDQYKGFELVSPIFDLYDTDTLTKNFNHPMIKPLIDAKYSERCGGHINVASTEYTPDQLANGFLGFMPLLYSIYESRINRDYSRAKDKHKYFAERGKYSAMFIKDHLVELRIFPAVKNVDNLMWRVGLVRIMVENLYKSELDVLKMLLNTRSRLYKHMALIFDDHKILDKANKFIKHSNIYNGTKLEMPKKKSSKTTTTNK
jgi:hypothetical protein